MRAGRDFGLFKRPSTKGRRHPGSCTAEGRGQGLIGRLVSTKPGELGQREESWLRILADSEQRVRWCGLLPSEGRLIMMGHPRGHPGEPGGWGSRETRLVQDSRSVRTGCRPAVQLPLSGSESYLAPSPGAVHLK